MTEVTLLVNGKTGKVTANKGEYLEIKVCYERNKFYKVEEVRISGLTEIMSGTTGSLTGCMTKFTNRYKDIGTVTLAAISECSVYNQICIKSSNKVEVTFVEPIVSLTVNGKTGSVSVSKGVQFKITVTGIPNTTYVVYNITPILDELLYTGKTNDYGVFTTNLVRSQDETIDIQASEKCIALCRASNVVKVIVGAQPIISSSYMYVILIVIAIVGIIYLFTVKNPYIASIRKLLK